MNDTLTEGFPLMRSHRLCLYIAALALPALAGWTQTTAPPAPPAPPSTPKTTTKKARKKDRGATPVTPAPMPAPQPPGPKTREVPLFCPAAETSGTMVIPPSMGKVPCVVILGDSLSADRAGNLIGEAAPRDALKKLADALTEAGYASLRYDRVGYGASKPTQNWRGTYQDELQVALAAISAAHRPRELGKVIVVGEGDGAYLACLAAAESAPVDGYVLLNPPCGPWEELYAYRWGRLNAWATGDNRSWAERNARHELALGAHFREMLAAASAGKDDWELVDGEYRATCALARLREALQRPPEGLFQSVTQPALVLTAERDVYTPPACSARGTAAMTGAGNKNITSVSIPGVDHFFQPAAEDEGTRIREWYGHEGISRPYDPRLYAELLTWLQKVAPAPPPPPPPAPPSTDMPAPATDKRTTPKK